VAARADIGLIEVTKARFDLNHLAREVVASLPDNRVRVIGETTIAVFEPYRTDAEAETRPGRLGLGLVVARQLARLMDGDVTYERRNGLSSFVFTLPKAT
jgi:K+-sensing histidine kinase KdpD